MKRLWSLLIEFLIYAAAQVNAQPVEKPLLPEAAQAAYDRGMKAAKIQDWKAAIQSFTEAQKVSPNRPVILFNLGLAHAKANHEIPAIAWLRTYLASEPAAPNTAAVRAEIRRLEARVQDRITKLFQAAAAAAQQIPQDIARGRAIGRVAGRQSLWGDIEGAIQTMKSLKVDQTNMVPQWGDHWLAVLVLAQRVRVEPDRAVVWMMACKLHHLQTVTGVA